MKKVLLLGGSYFQIPSIKCAKKLGYYTITCDYLPNNPGHKFADEYHNVSTTDKEAAAATAPKVYAMIDKLAKMGLIHKNKASNLKSGLAVYINKLQA